MVFPNLGLSRSDVITTLATRWALPPQLQGSQLCFRALFKRDTALASVSSIFFALTNNPRLVGRSSRDSCFTDTRPVPFPGRFRSVFSGDVICDVFFVRDILSLEAFWTDPWQPGLDWAYTDWMVCPWEMSSPAPDHLQVVKTLMHCCMSCCCWPAFLLRTAADMIQRSVELENPRVS